MKVLVTGASGFLGRAVVPAVAAVGHEVIALVRPTAAIDSLAWPNSIAILRGDLRQLGDWSTQLGDVEAVVHLAAASSGDLPTQFSGTVAATEEFKQFLDCIPIAIVVSKFFRGDQRICYANEAFETLSGRDTKDCAGKGWSILSGFSSGEPSTVPSSATFSAPSTSPSP